MEIHLFSPQTFVVWLFHGRHYAMPSRINVVSGLQEAIVPKCQGALGPVDLALGG